MYKIYINDITVLIVNYDQISNYQINIDYQYSTPYLGKISTLKPILNLCDDPKGIKEIIIYTFNPQSVLNGFKRLVKEVPAGGGVVFNENREILFIFRRAHWDLPKGKMDPGEKIEETALREVIEETGISDVTISEFIDNTYHIYRTINNGRRYLKNTYWYKMNTKKQKIKIQVEEDIEQAVWLSKDVFLNNCKPVYPNILDIVKLI